MWKSQVGRSSTNGGGALAANPPKPLINNQDDDDDDWETDPDYVNEMSEEQQRWGGARDTGTIE